MNFITNSANLKCSTVVYFEFAWSKTIKNIRKSWKKYLFLHAHERLTKKNEEKLYVSLLCASRAHDEKGTFLLIFKCFWSFATMQTHAQACVRWSKYTTFNFFTFPWKLRLTIKMTNSKYIQFFVICKTLLLGKHAGTNIVTYFVLCYFHLFFKLLPNKLHTSLFPCKLFLQ